MDNLKYFAHLNDENLVLNITTTYQEIGNNFNSNIKISTEVVNLMVEYIVETETNLGSTEEQINQKVKNYIDGLEQEQVGQIPIEQFNVLQYSLDNSITNNRAEIGYTYNKELNAFIPPQPEETYILNQETFVWEPDLNLTYELHGDGVFYKYNKELNGWTISET
jgi:hypothetical protein